MSADLNIPLAPRPPYSKMPSRHQVARPVAPSCLAIAGKALLLALLLVGALAFTVQGSKIVSDLTGWDKDSIAASKVGGFTAALLAAGFCYAFYRILLKNTFTATPARILLPAPVRAPVPQPALVPVEMPPQPLPKWWLLPNKRLAKLSKVAGAPNKLQYTSGSGKTQIVEYRQGLWRKGK